MDTDLSNVFSVRSVFSSAACNRSPNCLDWGFNNYIAYGACNAIILYKPEGKHGGRVVKTLICHKKVVTSVQWIKNGNNAETELLSTSVDHTAVIWTKQNDLEFVPEVLKGHTNIVKTSSALYTTTDCAKSCDTQLLVATASIDSTVKIWRRIKGKIECGQTLDFGCGFATQLKLTLLNQAVPLLAIASDDIKVHLYSQDDYGQFNLLTSLTGHEDWIQGLDFAKDGEDVLLASGAQDSFIRVWRISPKAILDASDSTLKLKQTALHIGKTYYVSLETILSGHENWVYSVKWGYKKDSDDSQLELLSTSMDRTMIVWHLDLDLHLWVEKMRVGDVGGNTLGFYGGVFSPCSEMVMAHSYQGSIHLWCYDKLAECWYPGIAFSGHFGPVKDLAWDSEGAFVISCSEDQTTRLFAPWANTHIGTESEVTWHELARPQIHGYDMTCVAILNRYKFISGADEKVFRVFDAPRSFADNLKNICGIDTSEYSLSSLPEGASITALGLSNKAIFNKDIENYKRAKDSERHAKDVYPTFYYSPVVITEPPAEEILLQNTLWPEANKLYAHPYEVFAVAANSKGTIVATSCKASKTEHAAILVWDVVTWRQVACLEFHSLTVTQMEFSPCDQYLLSVSRDRLWAVYGHFQEENPPYRLIANSEKKTAVHSRIIWSCSWSHDSLYFSTASRDKKVVVWCKSADNHDVSFSPSSSPLEVKDSATAVAFAPSFSVDNKYIIVVGFENGQMQVCLWDKSNSWSTCFYIDRHQGHHLAVNRLKFAPMQPTETSTSNKELILASCGNDCFVRIYALCITPPCCF